MVVGDKVPVVFPDSGKHVFTVKAIYAEEGPTGGYAISLAAFNANVPDKVDSFLLVDTAKGYSSSQARTAIEKVLHNYPNATVRTQDEFKGTIASKIHSKLSVPRRSWRWPSHCSESRTPWRCRCSSGHVRSGCCVQLV